MNIYNNKNFDRDITPDRKISRDDSLKGRTQIFSTILPIKYVIVPFFDKRGEEKQMIKIGNLPYITENLGKIDMIDFSWPNKVFIAKKGKQVIGWVTYQIKGNNLKNLKIAVDYSTAEKGVGKALLQKCIDFAKDSGFNSISAMIFYSNLLSQGLFKSMGFKLRRSTNPAFYGYIAELKL